MTKRITSRVCKKGEQACYLNGAEMAYLIALCFPESQTTIKEREYFKKMATEISNKLCVALAELHGAA